MSVDIARIEFSQHEYRSVEVQDAAVLVKHPLAIELYYKTLLANSTDATAFGNQVLNLRKLDRWTWACYVKKGFKTFTPDLSYDFSEGVEGFTGTAYTVSAANGILSLVATGATPNFLTPTTSFSGADSKVIRMRVRCTSGSPDWSGICYYTTSAGPDPHGATSSYRKVIDAPSGWTSGNWVNAEWDMANLTDGGADWLNSTISRIRFDLTLSQKNIEIDWLAVGDVVDNSGLEIGQTITLNYPRYGFDLGKNFIIKRVKTDSNALFDELTLFGPE